MANEISTPVKLANNNIVPGTERIIIPGANISVLVRDRDYLIDNKEGELRFLLDGVVPNFSDLVVENGLEISYNFRVDFENEVSLNSQVEVSGEVVVLTDPDDTSIIKVINSPIDDVERVFNVTTQEEYEVLSVGDDVINISGLNLPRIVSVANTETSIRSRTLKDIDSVFASQAKVEYPSSLNELENPVVEITSLTSQSTTKLLIEGGVDFLSTQIQLFVPQETVSIILKTGGTTLRRSTHILIEDTDYTAEFENTINPPNSQRVTITLSLDAQRIIGINSLYIILNNEYIVKEFNKIEDENIQPYQTEFIVDFTNHLVSEDVIFDTDRKELAYFIYTIEEGAIDDDLIAPGIRVFDETGFIEYKEDQDFTVNAEQKTLELTVGSSISQGETVIVFYLDDEKVFIDFNAMRDLVLADYTYGTNSIDFSLLIQDEVIFENEAFSVKEQSHVLQKIPLDYSMVKIYLDGDLTKTQQTTIIDFNIDSYTLIFEPILRADNYVIEYETRYQPIEENTEYFVSYKYGARRRALINNFAPQLGLDQTNVLRQESKIVIANQNSVTLDITPIDYKKTNIYKADDPAKTTVAQPMSFNSISKVLTFTPLQTTETLIFEYETTGFDTANLRNAISGLTETFLEGPTMQGFIDLGVSFTGLEPDIVTASSNSFKIGLKNEQNENYKSDRLNPLDFESSPDLPDETESIKFLPARFSTGAVFKSENSAFMKIPIANNLSVHEGTMEFLVGTMFNGNDDREHYFLDYMGTDEMTNRFSVYKGDRNFLNFDIWDNNSLLHRSTIDVNKFFNSEVVTLEVGDTEAVLVDSPTYAQSDVNEDGVIDLYLAHETEFFIYPVSPTFGPDFITRSVTPKIYDPVTQKITFDPIEVPGDYVLSYVSGFTNYEETENFIAVTWKLHTNDGTAPFYRLYVNGVKVKNILFGTIDFRSTAGIVDELIVNGKSIQYNLAEYDESVYNPGGFDDEGNPLPTPKRDPSFG